MSRLVLIIALAVALALFIVGIVVGLTVLAIIGLFGAVAVVGVQALILGGDWIRDASAGRFRRDGR